MIVCIKENYVDTTAYERFINKKDEFTEETNNFEWVEIEDKYSDCNYEDFDFINDKYVFNENKYNDRKVRLANNLKINKYKNWFNNDYREKIEKYTRLIALNKLDDDGSKPQDKLNDLYIQAEDVRKEIQRLGG